MTSITDPRSKTVSFTFNSYDQITNISDPLTHDTDFTYDAYGRLTDVDDALSKNTHMSYFADGRVESIRDAELKTTWFQYDTYGSLSQVTPPVGNAVSYQSDVMGRLTKVTDAGSRETDYTYVNGLLDRITYPNLDYTEYGYTTKGYLQSVRLPDAKTYTYHYNTKDRVDYQQLPDTSQIGFAYDANGNLDTITDRGGKVVDFDYYLNNRIDTVDHYGIDPLDINYDGVGNVTGITDGKSQSQQFIYDDANRLTSHDSIGYGYDDASRMTSMSDGLGTHSFGYSDRNELTSHGDPRGRTVSYTYYDDGPRESLAITGGGAFTLNYGYDDANRLTGVDDGVNQLLSVVIDLEGYDTSLTYANASVAGLTYDRDKGVLSGLTIAGTWSLTGTHDAAKRLTQEVINGVQKDYRYTSIGELDEVDRGGILNEAYDINTDGNRTQKSVGGVTTTYGYNTHNQLTSSVTGGVTTTYTYDLNGNLETKDDGTDAWQYLYDTYNRLIEVKLNTVTVQTNEYDGMGRRVRKSSAAGTRNYYYDGADPILETDAAGNPLVAYLAGNVIEVTGSTRYVPLYDMRGSIVALMDGAGTIVAEYEYDAYGTILSNSNPTIALTHFYTGSEWDEEIGLYHMGARYYDPQAGRFITPDPISVAGGVHVYRYCGDDPVNRVDPSGLQSYGPSWAPYYQMGPSNRSPGSYAWGQALAEKERFDEYLGTAVEEYLTVRGADVWAAAIDLWLDGGRRKDEAEARYVKMVLAARRSYEHYVERSWYWDQNGDGAVSCEVEAQALADLINRDLVFNYGPNPKYGPYRISLPRWTASDVMRESSNGTNITPEDWVRLYLPFVASQLPSDRRQVGPSSAQVQR